MATETQAVTLPDGTIAHFEVSRTASAGYADVAFSDYSFKGVLESLEGLAATLGETLKKAKPRSASVELGVELSAKEGKLLAVFVQGEGKANLKITLTWGEG
jgi:hypothetical protein